MKHRRRPDQDSNLGACEGIVFETIALDHSAIRTDLEKALSLKVLVIFNTFIFGLRYVFILKIIHKNMARKILMLHAKECIDAMLMMPLLKGLHMGGKYNFEFHDVWHDEVAKKVKEQHLDILKKTGKADAVPLFIDVEKQEAIFAPNFEKLMAWLEGPEWWKK